MNRKDYFYDVKQILKSRKDKDNEKKRVEKLEAEEPILIGELTKMDHDWKSKNERDIDYNKVFSPTLGLKKKEYNTTSRDVFEDIAEDKYDAKYKDDRNKLIRQYVSKSKDAQKELDDIYNNESDDLRDIADKYAKRKRDKLNATNDKGIGKSSIARLVQNEIDGEKMNEIEDVRDETSARVKEKNDVLKKLKQDKDKALENLDVKRAYDVSREIDRLEREQDKENDNITKFNNDVDQRESEYLMKRGDAIEHIKNRQRQEARADRQNEYRFGYSDAKTENYQARLNLAMDFYNQMPRDVAIASITDNKDLKRLLGRVYGDLLALQKFRDE